MRGAAYRKFRIPHQRRQAGQRRRRLSLKRASDPPPFEVSGLMYGFRPEMEDHDAEEETQAGRDRREVCDGLPGRAES